MDKKSSDYEEMKKTIQDIREMIQEICETGYLSDKWYESEPEPEPKPALKVIRGGLYCK